MSSLSSTLVGASSALEAFQYALSVTQNNIDNASTPDYAKQNVALQADPFDPAVGLGGRRLQRSADRQPRSAGRERCVAAGRRAGRRQRPVERPDGRPECHAGIGPGAGIPAALNYLL